MKICILSSCFGGGYGTGYSLKKEVDELLKLGHELIIIHGESKIDDYKKSGVKYFYFAFSKIPILGVLILQRNINCIISKVLQENSVDIFYVHTLEFGLVSKKNIKEIPVVYFARSTIKGVEVHKTKEYFLDAIRKRFVVPLLLYLEKRCIKISQIIIVKSNIMKQELVCFYKVKSNKIKIIRGGIDTADFPKMNQKEILKFKKELGLSLNKKIILFAGRIAPVKGIGCLIDSFEILNEKIPNTTLLIVGKSMMSHYDKLIKKKVKKIKLNENIKFIGHISQKTIYKYFNICDIVVAPSSYEPFGMVNVQAIKLDKLLIATWNTGSVEVIKKYPGLKIVRSNSPQELAKELENILLMNDRMIIYNFDLSFLSWTSMVKNIEKLFKTVIIK
jgi:glycosyltransferase involved in cell wall biosynthesis